MLQDIEVSQDIMAGFKQFAAARRGSLAMDMNVLVLTSGFWPSYRSFDCLLPTELLKAQQASRECILVDSVDMFAHQHGHCSCLGIHAVHACCIQLQLPCMGMHCPRTAAHRENAAFCGCCAWHAVFCVQWLILLPRQVSVCRSLLSTTFPSMVGENWHGRAPQATA